MKNAKLYRQTATDGIIAKNPVFCLVLGMCPTIAMTSSLEQAVAMGLATTFVLVFSNLIVSVLRKLIPDKIRIPCYIVIVSTFVIMVEMVMKKFMPDLYSTMKVFISLIVVNCIILARAESFASCHTPLLSAVDGFSMGIGFTLALSLLGIIREFITTGKFYGMTVISGWPQMGAGAAGAFGFMCVGVVMALFNYVREKALEPKKGGKAQ